MSERKSVLIVDDSRVSRMMIRAIVTDVHPNWQVSEAASGEDVLSESSDSGYDLIISDYNMPGMDGVTLGRKLGEVYPGAAIFLLTANIQESVQLKAEQSGLHFVKKPITEDRIKGILSSLEG